MYMYKVHNPSADPKYSEEDPGPPDRNPHISAVHLHVCLHTPCEWHYYAKTTSLTMAFDNEQRINLIIKK